MSITQHWTVIGIFETLEQAKQAMNDLQQIGFQDDQLGFVYRDEAAAGSKASTPQQEETTDAFTSGIVGGVLGAADVLLTPILGPSVANTIPVSTMPVVNQIIDRFHHAGTTEQEHTESQTSLIEAPINEEQKADTMASPPSAMPDEAEVVTRQEQRLAAEESTGTIDTMPTEESIAPDEQRVREDEATGAVTGGIVGGVLGVAVALLLPILGPAFAGGFLVTAFSAALGAATGGFLGAFVAMGIPEAEARHYEQEFKAGRTILTVKTDDRQQEVLAILHRNRARYANAHEVR